MTAGAASDKATKDKYRQPVSIECPRSYEPRALPLRHVGCVAVETAEACSDKPAGMINTPYRC